MPTLRLLLFYLSISLIFGCSEDIESIEEDDNVKEIESLPMENVSLIDFSTFESKGKNWIIAGDVYTDYQDGKVFEVEPGQGIIVNKMGEGSNEALYSTFEHGDLEFQFEYLIPKSSNSGVYFQGRYELQLFDSYGVENVGISDAGAIYERWDESKEEGKKGYEGHPPLVNTSKAPGLWQEMKVYFRAPKFNEQGEKIVNARFESVYHNGILVQDDVELNGPTRGPFLPDEAEYGPLIIQGDHGNIAFRNIKYKSYTQDSLTLSDLTYKYFEHPYDVTFPEFDTVKIIKEGKADYFNPNIANEKGDHYGLIFNGRLHVPVSGTYLFKTGIDDGGDILINGKTVVHNEGSPGYSRKNESIELDSGTVDFELRFYDNVWRAAIDLEYEGPGIYTHRLGMLPQKKRKRNNDNLILIKSVDEPEWYRNFSMYNGIKKTHTISIATPSNLHYTYDLQEGSLLKFWRGDFADLTDMWRGRGEPQLLKPLNAEIESIDGIPLGSIKNNNWTSLGNDNLIYKGYEVASDGFPIFQYKTDQYSWTDYIKPSSDHSMLERRIKTTAGSKLSARIAKAQGIKELPNGLISIGGSYYVEIDSTFKSKIINDELYVEADSDGLIAYSIFW